MEKSKIGHRQMFVLTVTYILMIGLFYWFNSYGSSAGENSGVIYSIILYMVVLGMYIYSFSSFKKTNSITSALMRVTEEVREAYTEKEDYLWEIYKDKENLFNEEILDEQYERFCKEEKRLAFNKNKQMSYGDIENYINYELIDDTIHKNILSIFPGTMTGLGILFTFFGLSMCLQSFHTGSAKEIMAGIDPLMGGLKVAFHTSIYGLIFSLVYNICFRKILEDEYEAVDDFLDAFKECVKPENEADVARVLMDYQESQTRSINAFSSDMAGAFEKAMKPQFNSLNKTITSFANAASTVQTEGINRMVKAFLKEMDKSVGNNFREVRESMAKTCEIQGKYVSAVEESLNGISSTMDSFSNISDEMQLTVQLMKDHVVEIRGLQEKIKISMDNYADQVSANNELARSHQTYLVEMSNIYSTSSDALAVLISEIQACLTQLNEESGKFVKIAETSTDNIIMKTDTWIGDMDTNFTEREKKLKQTEIDLLNVSRTSMKTITQNVEDLVETITKQTNNQMTDISGLKNQISNDLAASAQLLEQAVNNFSIKLNDALVAGLSDYDQEFQKTVSELNKTVHSIRTSTAIVPQVINNAEQNLEAAIDETERNINQLINALDSMKKKVLVRQEAITFDEKKYNKEKAEIQASISEIKEREIKLQGLADELEKGYNKLINNPDSITTSNVISNTTPNNTGEVLPVGEVGQSETVPGNVPSKSDNNEENGTETPSLIDDKAGKGETVSEEEKPADPKEKNPEDENPNKPFDLIGLDFSDL